MFSGCPSIRLKPEMPSFHLYRGPLIHPTNRDLLAACPSVCLSVLRFPGIYRRMHRGNGLKICMLIYLDHLQNGVVYGHSLLIFLILALFWLSETGQIWGFQAFLRECMGEWSEILHADVSWPLSELISLWSQSVDFSNFGAILT